MKISKYTFWLLVGSAYMALYFLLSPMAYLLFIYGFGFGKAFNRKQLMQITKKDMVTLGVFTLIMNLVAIILVQIIGVLGL